MDIAVIKDLTYCLGVLSEVIKEKELTQTEASRVKYVQKLITETTDKIKIPEAKPSYYIFHNNEIIGKLNTATMVLTIAANLSGHFNITPLTDKNVVTAYMIEEII